MFVPLGQQSGVNEILQRVEGGQREGRGRVRTQSAKLDLDGCNISMERVEEAGDTALQN